MNRDYLSAQRETLRRLADRGEPARIFDPSGEVVLSEGSLRRGSDGLYVGDTMVLPGQVIAYRSTFFRKYFVGSDSV